MPNKVADQWYSDATLGKLGAGIARFQLNAAQAYCGACNIYLTVFAEWNNDNYAKATEELLKHKREQHAKQA